jgi:Ca2+-binding EF-hand superfamily protein
MRMVFGSISFFVILAVGSASGEDPPEKRVVPKPGAIPPERPLHFDIDGFFKDHDKNKDGYLTRDEFPPALRPAFDRIDTNKDGKVSREELARGIVHLAPRRRPSDLIYTLIEMSDCDEECAGEVQRAYDILRKLDKNRDGKIDPEELKMERERIIKHRVDSLFKQLDTNQDGRISREEAKGPIRQNFDEIDRNRDGYIDREELMKAAMEKPTNIPPPPERKRPAPSTPPRDK